MNGELATVGLRPGEGAGGAVMDPRGAQAEVLVASAAPDSGWRMESPWVHGCAEL
jgi:hypothetical protein